MVGDGSEVEGALELYSLSAVPFRIKGRDHDGLALRESIGIIRSRSDVGAECVPRDAGVDVQLAPEKVSVRIVMVASGSGDHGFERGPFVNGLCCFRIPPCFRFAELSAGHQREHQGEKGQGEKSN